MKHRLEKKNSRTFATHLVPRLLPCVPNLNDKKTVILFHIIVGLTTSPKHLPKLALHLVRSRASSFKWEYPLLSLRSSNSFLRLLPRLPVTSIPPPFIFPSITRCRRQFLRKMWPNCDKGVKMLRYTYCISDRFLPVQMLDKGKLPREWPQRSPDITPTPCPLCPFLRFIERPSRVQTV
jgi:hypothetical protein